MNHEIDTLREWIAGSDNIVFFGGAGVSTESGIPDFRSVDGLYHQQYRYPPETIISHSFFAANPEEFYRFYRDKLVVRGARPNRAAAREARRLGRQELQLCTARHNPALRFFERQGFRIVGREQGAVEPLLRLGKSLRQE